MGRRISGHIQLYFEEVSGVQIRFLDWGGGIFCRILPKFAISRVGGGGGVCFFRKHKSISNFRFQQCLQNNYIFDSSNVYKTITYYKYNIIK